MPLANPILKRLNNHIKKNFGVMLRAELKSRGIKYSFIAEKIGVERSFFHRVLEGQDFLSAEAIYTIADILGVEADSLLARVYYSKDLGDYLEGD
jgi:transcriptional regulator with XRE-family HTH domain